MNRINNIKIKLHYTQNMSAIVENTLFTQENLSFDSKLLDTQLVPVPLTGDIKFGILDMKAISAPLTKETLEFLFNLDRSGSMSDICSDGRTKMQHIIHTMTNIVTYLRENPTIQAFITIDAFDSYLYKIVERTNITEDNYKEIIDKIERITPRDTTDIGNALTNTRKVSDNLREQFLDHKQNHIFMTDGQITQGITDRKKLIELVDNKITNAFIGFGLDHDANLLNALSSGNNSNYYFVDKLENAGLVYGEILHGIVYRFLTDVVINVSGGLIYNFKTNEWAPNLAVGEIVSESNKTFHIISNSLEDCKVEIICRRVSDGSEVSTFILRQEDSDLTKYIYRQRTQQLLYKVKDFISKRSTIDEYLLSEDERKTKKEKNVKMKTEMTGFLKEVKKHMEENQLTEDPFYKNLCDDVYICLRTFETEHAEMFISARSNTQGLQRAYNSNNIPERCAPRHHLRRANAINFDGCYDDEDEFPILHTISDSVTTPYRSASQGTIMRAVSENSEDEETYLLPV